MADSSKRADSRGSRDLLPSPRHLPVSRDQRSEATFNPADEGKDKLTTLLNEVKSLQDQIVQMQQSSQSAQINEPHEKRLKVVLDDHKTHLLEIKARMQQQEQTHEFQMGRLKESMTKAQADIQYLLEKTQAMEQGVSAEDQPRRTMDRAFSGQKLNLLQERTLPEVNLLSAQPDLPLKPALLFTNTGQAQPSPMLGTARQRSQRSRPPLDGLEPSAGSASGMRSILEAKGEEETLDQIAPGKADQRSSSAVNKINPLKQADSMAAAEVALQAGPKAQPVLLDEPERAVIRAEYHSSRARATQEEEERIQQDQPHKEIKDMKDMKKEDWEAHRAAQHSSHPEASSSSEVSSNHPPQRSTSQHSARSTCSTMSQRARSHRRVEQQSREQFNPMLHRPHLQESAKLNVIDFEGRKIPDLEYGNLGEFNPLKFDTEASTNRSLGYLDLTGSMAAASYSTVLKLSGSVIKGHRVQGNPCLLVNFVPNLGMQEDDVVWALTTLGGALAFPNFNIVGIVVSYKFNIALLPDEHGMCDDSSQITREFNSMDGQVFMACQSIQIAEAYKDYLNSNQIKFRSYDPVNRSTDFWFHTKVSVVTSKEHMQDLKTNLQMGKMRQGSDVFVCPGPDHDDPQWVRVDGKWQWRSRYVRREDWDGPQFYRSTVLFQKHWNRNARVLDLASGRHNVPYRSTLDSITPLYTYEFLNDAKFKSSKVWTDRRASSRG